MGGCASAHQSRTTTWRRNVKKPGPPVIRVVQMDGRVKEFNPPICAAQIVSLSQNQGCFLCNCDDLFIDSYPDHVPEPEYLRPGRVYILIPNSHAHKPFSLVDLCELAIKASPNLSIRDLQLSFRSQ